MISKRQEAQRKTTYETKNDLETSGDRERRRTNPIMISKREEAQRKTTHESNNDLETSGATDKDDARIQ